VKTRGGRGHRTVVFSRKRSDIVSVSSVVWIPPNVGRQRYPAAPRKYFFYRLARAQHDLDMSGSSLLLYDNLKLPVPDSDDGTRPQSLGGLAQGEPALFAAAFAEPFYQK